MRKPLPQAPPAAPGSLAEALASVPDPRHPYGWRPQYPPIPLVALLQLAVTATLCGARSLYAIAQWGRERLEDEPELLESLGVPPGRSPSVATLHRVFKALDVAAFEVTLVIPEDLVAVSNTPVVEEAPSGTGRKSVRFAETPVMSTYLLAFVVMAPQFSIAPAAKSGMAMWSSFSRG